MKRDELDNKGLFESIKKSIKVKQVNGRQEVFKIAAAAVPGYNLDTVIRNASDFDKPDLRPVLRSLTRGWRHISRTQDSIDSESNPTIRLPKLGRDDSDLG